MKLATHFRIAQKSLERISQKVALFVLLLSLGVACLYCLVYLGQAAGQETARRFYSQGYDLFSIIKKRDSGRIGPAQMRQMDAGLVKFLKYSPQHVMAVAPELMITESLSFDGQDLQVPVIGVLEEYLTVHALEVEDGRFFSKYDSTKPYCVIGSHLAERLKLASNNPPVGAKFYLNNSLMENIGVLKQSQSFVSDFSIDEALLIPLNTLQQYLENPEIKKITVRANPNSSVLDVVEYLEKNLKIYLGDNSNYEVNNQSLFLQEISKQQQYYSIVFGLFGVLFMLLGAFALYRITCLLILRRRREVAFIQDFHMQDKILLLQFFIESMLPVFLAGGIGILLGILFTYYVSLLSEWMFFISHLGWIISISIALFVGLAMGWFPAVVSMYSKKK
jgi:putative ABC transport system permease protein